MGCMLPPPPLGWHDGPALEGALEMYTSALWADQGHRGELGDPCWLDEAETCLDDVPTELSELLRLASLESLDDMPTLPAPPRR
jgi:hypothetical protein